MIFYNSKIRQGQVTSIKPVYIPLRYSGGFLVQDR
jgi:hypothetical protein